MINFVDRRKYYFIASGSLIVLSILSFIIYGLKFSIDFTGGSEFSLSGDIENDKVEQIFTEENVDLIETRQEGDITVFRIREISQDKREAIEKKFEENLENATVEEFQVIGPIIGEETKSKAIQAVVLAIFAILLYIAIAFRKVARPVASWKFGLAAIAALIHDVVITLGAFSLFGEFFGVELDPLFITAILTVMGFSVHDTIVTFDRVRENLENNVRNIPFANVVNNSILETLGRSINTSATVLFVLLALLLFGGDSIRWFVAALTIGVVVGVYSSIFIASQILVEWNERGSSKKKKA